jgi:hypothetical protein
MPDYNLNALDRRSFEQIVQAIAKKGNCKRGHFIWGWA